MIPRRIHFIFGLEPSFGNKPFSFVHYLAIRSAAVVNRPDEIVFHYAHEPDTKWWEAAKKLVTLDRVKPRDEIFGRPISHFAHKADILRLELLNAEGGIYLDIDTFCIRPLEPLLVHDSVMGVEPNAGLCNAVILARPQSEFIKRWIEHYRDFDDTLWDLHSVQLPYSLALAYPGLVHVESEYSFFFPTYDDPMALWLWQCDLGLADRVRGAFKVAQDTPYYLAKEGPVRIWGYLRHAVSSKRWFYERLRNSYCLHLWESIWWDAHLQRLNPKELARAEGLYAKLVIEVLPDVIGL